MIGAWIVAPRRCRLPDNLNLIVVDNWANTSPPRSDR
jgi:hypothetical protein